MKTERILEVLLAAEVADLICSYGSEFFPAGQEGVDYSRLLPTGRPLTFARNTLNAVANRGLLHSSPGLSGRGRYALTGAGRNFLRDHPDELAALYEKRMLAAPSQEALEHWERLFRKIQGANQ